jgi:hypothetical protein
VATTIVVITVVAVAAVVVAPLVVSMIVVVVVAAKGGCGGYENSGSGNSVVSVAVVMKGTFRNLGITRFVFHLNERFDDYSLCTP